MQIVKEGKEMKASEIIVQAIADRGVQKQNVAAYMGWRPSAFANRIRNNTFSFDEVKKIIDFLGYDVKIVDTASETISVRERKKGVGAKVTKTINKAVYSTEKSDAVCHSVKQGGCFFELYKDLMKDQFFIVSYIENSEEAHITLVTQAIARKFCEGCEVEFPNEYFKE